MYLLWPLYPSLPYRCKKIRDGVTRTRLILQNYPRVILSLAPSWACEFEDLSIGQLIAAIRKLGFFRSIRDCDRCRIGLFTGIGLSTTIATGVYISSACPVVVEYIRKYSAEHTPAITPMLSPYVSSCQNF